MAKLQKKRTPTKTEKEGIFSFRQKGRCNYCGKKPVSMTGMHFDHIVRPQDWTSNDDVNDVNNIQSLCHECHTHKTSEERKGYSDKEIRKIYKLGSNTMKAPTRQLFSNPTKYYSEIRFGSKTSTRKSTKNKPAVKKTSTNETVLTIRNKRSIVQSPKFKIYDDEEDKWRNLEVVLRGQIEGDGEYLKIGNDARIKNNPKSNKIKIDNKGSVKDKIEYNIPYEGWTTVRVVYLAYEDDWGDYIKIKGKLGKKIKITK